MHKLQLTMSLPTSLIFLFLSPALVKITLLVDNGQHLPITHTSNITFLSHHSTLHLNNVLRVPSIASNLAFVHKICHDNYCWCHFDENIISIQALATGNVLYQVKSEQSVYPIYPHKASKLSFSPKFCNTVSTSSS